MQDVEHSMNILEVDLAMNKILFKTLKEVEVQLHINQKFAKEKKRIKKDMELREMEASRIELRQNHRKQRRCVAELKEVDENLKYFQTMVDNEKTKSVKDLAFREQTLEMLIRKE